MFTYAVVPEIINDDYESQLIIKYCQRQEWPRCEEAIQAKIAFLFQT